MVSDRILALVPAFEWPEKDAEQNINPDDPGFLHCREVTRRHARSFFFASHFLPSRPRVAAYAIYTYCRYIDDAIDEASGPETAPDRTHLTNLTERILDGSNELPFAAAFRQTCEVYRIPHPLLDQLIEGCCRDREPLRLETFTELEEYCYYVASVVGLMMCPVFGCRADEALSHAVDMGIAMQLTNIIRDIREDWEMGRRYLPAEELAGHGLTINASFFRQPPGEAWVRAP